MGCFFPPSEVDETPNGVLAQVLGRKGFPDFRHTGQRVLRLKPCNQRHCAALGEAADHNAVGRDPACNLRFDDAFNDGSRIFQPANATASSVARTSAEITGVPQHAVDVPLKLTLGMDELFVKMVTGPAAFSSFLFSRDSMSYLQRRRCESHVSKTNKKYSTLPYRCSGERSIPAASSGTGKGRSSPRCRDPPVLSTIAIVEA